MNSPDPQRLRGGTLYFDCASGIAGDMTVGALVDLGVPEAVIREALEALPLRGYRVEFARVMRGGLAGTKFRVHIDAAAEHALEAAPAHAHAGHEHQDHHEHEGHAHHGAAHPDHDPHGPGASAAHHHGYGVGGHAEDSGHRHTHYGAIRQMLLAAPLGAGVRARALAMFDRLAEVEARLHGVSVEEVAFHEVGAVDSIVDVVGAAAALDWLRPARVVARRVPLGRGFIQTAHGRLPVPAPATLELLRGVPVEEGGIDGELTTPTGAAVLAATVGQYGSLPPLTVAGVGWGAGDRDLPGRPNLLRVVAGAPEVQDAGEAGGYLVIEANIDDMQPELLPPLLEALLAAGARDAWFVPVLMKKGRPGYVVAAVVEEAQRQAVEQALLTESTTIGLRRHAVARTMLPRHIIEVDTEFGRIPIKVAGEAERWLNAAPEFEACRRIAAERGVPLKRVYAAATAAFWRQQVIE
ncbi:MAG TPA: nickel pincer cofactor biosynthesis protein LarC [Polyangia bacterium]|nr:nickel pincer cofactor biosynthesis protein LarC [Polyangia bacterium]